MIKIEINSPLMSVTIETNCPNEKELFDWSKQLDLISTLNKFFNSNIKAEDVKITQL